MDVKCGRALVTGGAQGIGRAICEALLNKGCKVCCADVNSVKGKKTVEELRKAYGDSNCIFVKCDVSSAEEFEAAYSKARESFGNLNILINNAGVSGARGVIAVDINLKGSIHCCNIALKYMGKNNGGDGGVVVSVASVAGLHYYPYDPIYTATKAGVVALIKSYGHQRHYDISGIKFVSVCPSFVDTEMYRGLITACKHDKETEEILDSNPPLEPSKVAEAVIRLVEEGRNGAVMAVSQERGITYINFPGDELRK